MAVRSGGMPALHVYYTRWERLRWTHAAISGLHNRRLVKIFVGARKFVPSNNCRPLSLTSASCGSGAVRVASQGNVECCKQAAAEESLVGEDKWKWKWSMVLAYDGTKYSGWQSQPRKITVQQTIEDALFQITRCPQDELSVTGAGRTDAGVHACGQVVHFCTPFIFKELGTLHTSLNSILPNDVRIIELRAVQPQFHARFSARNKTYQYKAYLGPVMDPFQRSYAFHFPHVINLDAVQEAATLFVGEHNFLAFANSSSRVLNNPIREITKFSVMLVGPHLLFEVQGKGFFYKQVRNMVGLLLEIGKETIPVTAVLDVLASHNRKTLAKVAATAPAYGLYLVSVDYDDALFSPPNQMPIVSYGHRQQQATQTTSYTLASATQ